MAEEFRRALQTLNLSANNITQMTGWPEPMTNDYLTNLRNFQRIANLSDLVLDRVEINEENIQLNTDNIQINVNNIQTNGDNIQTNADDISTLNTTIGDHISSSTQHGVTGDNVGTGDYCTSLVGGVVNLAALIADLTVIATTDIAAAPAAYNQAYTQTVADLNNENKSKINEMVLKVNAIILGQITAKQMAAI